MSTVAYVRPDRLLFPINTCKNKVNLEQVMNSMSYCEQNSLTTEERPVVRGEGAQHLHIDRFSDKKLDIITSVYTTSKK